MLRMQKNKFLNFMGICKKSGKVVLGDHMVEKEMNRESLKLVVVATDTSERIWAKYERFCKEKNVPVIRVSTKEELGKHLGKESVAVVGFNDKNQSTNLVKLYENLKETGGVL
jgi:ribosomal protein L7Ae-like RNA K-turn-binding protein